MYLVFFGLCASSVLSYHGTVSSTMATCFELCDHSTMSGCKVVVVTHCGNTSFLSTSTDISHCPPDISNPPALSAFPLLCCPACTKLMKLVFCLGRAFLLIWSITPPSSLSTLSWRHLYLPCERLTGHPERTCFNVPLFPHRVQLGSSFIPQVTRLAGVGSWSYTALIRNFRRCCSFFHISSHDIFL